MAAVIFNVLLMLDGAIYNLIDYLYDIFDFLARINIFSQDDYNQIVERIYIVLGIFMLFVLAYSLLRAVISPDDFAKGENSFPNLIKNVIISLVIIVLLPTVFTTVFNIQNVILNNDTIPRLILGGDFTSTTNADAGRRMAYYSFNAFFHENETWCQSEGYSTDDDTCADHIAGNGWLILQNGPSLSSVRKQVLENDVSFTSFSQYGEAVDGDQIEYMFLISTVAGIFIAYVLLNFCFDLAVRVVKLAFYQIIAPIPVVCRILPGGNMKDVFSKWVKQVISIFLEVFIRIGIMYIGIFIITLIIDNFDNIPGLNDLSLTKQLIVQALLIIGTIIFIRQAPKLLGELLNLDTGGMKLGLMDKLSMGGGLIAGAAAGGLATTGIRNFAGAFIGKGIGKDLKSGHFGSAFKKIGGSTVSGIKSGIAGAGSGAVRAGFNARGAKNFGDMKGAVSKGVAGATEAKFKRASYKASHRVDRSQLKGVGNIPVIGAAAAGVASSFNTLYGHGQDVARNVGQFIGINNMQALLDENKTIDEIMSKKDAIKDAAQELILGEAKKNKNKSFGIDPSKTFSNTSNLGLQYSAFTTANLRDLQQKMEVAKQTGFAVDSFGVQVSAQEWENLYGQYLSEFTDEVQNQALQSTANYKAMINNAQNPLEMEADFASLQSAVSDFRRTIKDNSLNSAVVNAGLTTEMVSGSKDLKVKDVAMDNLGKSLKIAKAKNVEKINELRSKQNNDSNK